MLHETTIEYFAGEPPIAEEPQVLLPTFRDGMQDSPRKLKIQVGNGPRDPFDDVPQWFINSIRTVFPKTFTGEGDDETAVTYFRGLEGYWLDHWGWVDEVLVSEPYRVTMKEFTELTDLCRDLNWTFRIVGKSAHYPSATFRIEIRPAKAAA